MAEKKIMFDGAEIRGTILYCPDCGHRIGFRENQILSGAIETFLVVRGVCKCPIAPDDWSFTFKLPIPNNDPNNDSNKTPEERLAEALNR